MIIILEGGDNVGKTTLANKLKVKLPNYKLIHNGKYMFRIIALIDYYWQVKFNKNVIIDRSIISEIIYGELYRNKNKFGWCVKLLTWMLNNENVIICNIWVDINKSDCTAFFMKNNDTITGFNEDVKVNAKFYIFGLYNVRKNLINLEAHDKTNLQQIMERIR